MFKGDVLSLLPTCQTSRARSTRGMANPSPALSSLRQQGVYMLSREIQERGVIMKKVKLLLVAVVLGMTVMCSVPAGAAPSKSGPTLAWKLWGEHRSEEHT